MEILIILAGFLISRFAVIGIKFTEITFASAGFTVIALVTLLVFFRGQTRDPSSHTLHSFVAISLKLLIELVFTAIWIFVAKKTGLSEVLLFFVLYLSFTLFTVIIILKTLKSKSL